MNEATLIKTFISIKKKLYTYFFFSSCSPHICVCIIVKPQIPRLFLTGMTSQSGIQELINGCCYVVLVVEDITSCSLSGLRVFFAGQKPRWSIMTIFLFPSSLSFCSHLLPFQSQSFQSSYSKNAHLTEGRLHP